MTISGSVSGVPLRTLNSIYYTLFTTWKHTESIYAVDFCTTIVQITSIQRRLTFCDQKQQFLVFMKKRFIFINFQSPWNGKFSFSQPYTCLGTTTFTSYFHSLYEEFQLSAIIKVVSSEYCKRGKVDCHLKIFLHPRKMCLEKFINIELHSISVRSLIENFRKQNNLHFQYQCPLRTCRYWIWVVNKLSLSLL